jgi:hypothetical protein
MRGCGIFLSVAAVLAWVVMAPGAQARVYGQAAGRADGDEVRSGVLGEVTTLDRAGGQLMLKTDAGQTLQVSLDEKTLYRRVAPGEQSVSKADKITLADVSVGDRVYAQGKVEPGQTSLRTRYILVMSKAAIAGMRERESEDWRRRGIVGVVTAVDPERKEVKVERRAGGAAEALTLKADAAKFYRYSPDSSLFSDARASSLAELKPGDMVRARGDRGEGGVFTAQDVVSGSFRTVGGTVTSVSPDAAEVKMEEVPTRKPLTVVVNRNTVLRRMSPADASLFARKPGEGAAGAQGGADFQTILERQPALALSEIKPGDMILVSSSKGGDPARMTAITLVAGMDALLKQLQAAPPPQPGGPAPNTGLPVGIPIP